MFKNKFFLYGLGVGLIVASLLLQLVSMSSKLERDEEDAIEWDTFFEEHFEDISNAAQSHGYEMIDMDADDGSDEPELAEQISEPLEQPQAQSHREPTVLDITYGMTSIDVADLLEQLELIEERSAFEQSMSNRELNRRIQIGTYEFTEVPHLNELIELITK